MWAAVVVLIIMLAIIAVTIILVVQEFKKVKKDLVREETISRSNEKTLQDNVLKYLAASSNNMFASLNNTSSSLRSSNVTLSNSLNTSMSDVHTQISDVRKQIMASNVNLSNQVFSEMNMWETKQGTQLTNMVGAVSDDLASFFNPLTKTIVAQEMGIHGTQGSLGSAFMTYDKGQGLVIANNNGERDLSVQRAQVGTSLNIAGNLNFANNNSSYMLGVDGRNMYLKMNGPDHSFSIKDDKNMNRFDVNNSNITIDADARIVGSLNFADTSMSSSTHVLDTENGDLFVKPTLLTGAFIVKDSTNTNRFMVKNDIVKITGDTESSGKITSESQICIKDKCLTMDDITKLKSLSNI